MSSTIRTAVFPVAGLGTRFLPVTKTGPKELLPIIDKPIIQYVVEEAIAAGCTRLVFVTSHAKRAIEDYFDSNLQLEHALEEQGKHEQLQMIRNLVPEHVDIIYVRQKSPKGLGDAVLCARSVVGDEPFVVLLPDDILSEHSVLQGMVKQYQATHRSVIAVEEILVKDSKKYGMVALSDDMCLEQIVEKPQPEDSPSNFAVMGRYVFSATIFEYLSALQAGVDGEIQLTDAIAKLLLSVEGVSAYALTGKRYDCGDPAGYIRAVIDFSMQRCDLRLTLSEALKQLLHE